MSDERSPNRIDHHIGARLRLRRIMVGMSQEKLAELLGLTFQQIQKYERGINRIAASRLFDIAGVLEVPVTYFYEGAPAGAGGARRQPDAEASVVFDLIASPEGAQLAAAYAAIENAQVRRGVLELMRVLADQVA